MMKLSAMVSRLFGKRRNRSAKGHQAKNHRKVKPQLELLENRVVPTVTLPKILSVTPTDGSTTTTASPPVVVTYSENVVGAGTAGNYELFGTSGNQVPINSVSYTPITVTVNGQSVVEGQATINYAGPLVVDNYTLFVRGDNITDAQGNKLSQPGQVVVANKNNTVSTISMPGNGSLGAQSNVSVPPGFFGSQAGPSAVTLADVNGDGIPDLLVVDNVNDTLNIYTGQVGGGFSAFPATQLFLDFGSGANAVVAGNFTGTTWPNGKPMNSIAITEPNYDDVLVYVNLGVSVGDLSFDGGTDYDVDTSPNSIAMADFDGDGHLDLAVSNNGSNDVSVLPGNGDGSFGTAANFTTGAGSAPTGIAAGPFNGDALPDLVVSGAGGVRVLNNTSTVGFISFAAPTTLAGPATTSVAAGLIRATSVTNPQDDIVATSQANGGEILVWENNGSGTFSLLPALPANANPTSVTVADLAHTGHADILVANDNAAGQVTVFQNLSQSGAISSATGNGTTLTFAVTGSTPLQIGDKVLVSGVQGFPAANGLFTVQSTTNTSFAVAAAANGTGTGGTWSAVYLNDGSGTVTGASDVAGQPITITSRNDGLVSGQSGTITSAAVSGGGLNLSGSISGTLASSTPGCKTAKP
jgi:hypothetical protein